MKHSNQPIMTINIIIFLFIGLGILFVAFKAGYNLGESQNEVNAHQIAKLNQEVDAIAKQLEADNELIHQLTPKE